MKQLNKYLKEQNSIGTHVRLMVMNLDLKSENESDIEQVDELFDRLNQNEHVIDYKILSSKYIDLVTTLNIEDNVLAFSDQVLYELRTELNLSIKILFIGENTK